jgi:hypothetical protein
VEYKNWGNNKPLDLDAKPESYAAWRERALGYLAADRPDVRRLLLWAEKQGTQIDENLEKRGAAEARVAEDVEYISYIVFEAVKGIMSDGLLTRARTCGDGRGLELWRKLHAEWRGSAPQVIAAKARRYQDPERCASVQQLWDALPVWEALGSEVALGGYPIPDWVRAQALDKMMPIELHKIVMTRPELTEYTAKLSYVKNHMEFARGASQASWVNSKGGKDMDVGAVMKSDDAQSETSGADSIVWALQSELGRCSAEGDWSAVQALSGALFALGKGKGKGGGKSFGKGSWGAKGGGKGEKGRHDNGKGNKGGGKGEKGGGKGFDGYCNHCWKYGHRKAECRLLDAEMAAKKGGKGGKGAYELQAAAEEKEEPQPEDADEGEWWVGAVCALSRDEKQDFTRVASRHAAPPRPLQKSSTRCTARSCNSFAALADDDDEPEPDARNPTRGDGGIVGDSTGLARGTCPPSNLFGGLRGTAKAKYPCEAAGGPGTSSVAWRSSNGTPHGRPGYDGAQPDATWTSPMAWRPGLCGELAPRTGNPHGRPGKGFGAHLDDSKATNFYSGNKVRWCGMGTPACVMAGGSIQDLHKEELYNCEWPEVSGEVESRSSRKARAAKLRCFKNLSGHDHFQDVIDGHLSLLTKDSIPERFVGAVSKDESGKYRIVEAVVDSGAEESVAPPGCFPGEVTPSKMSKAGGKYRAANGARIPNLGQQKVPFLNEAGSKCGIVFQVAEVERPLISATQLAAAGNSIVINGSGGKIVNDKSGKIMKLVRRGGVLVLRMRIPTDGGSGFPGQGR